MGFGPIGNCPHPRHRLMSDLRRGPSHFGQLLITRYQSRSLAFGDGGVFVPPLPRHLKLIIQRLLIKFENTVRTDNHVKYKMDFKKRIIYLFIYRYKMQANSQYLLLARNLTKEKVV